jgi:hypothetical protein
MGWERRRPACITSDVGLIQQAGRLRSQPVPNAPGSLLVTSLLPPLPEDA